MKFTKGLFIGTALGISAAMMMNNKTNNNQNTQNSRNNQINQSTSMFTETDNQANDYIVNDII